MMMLLAVTSLVGVLMTASAPPARADTTIGGTGAGNNGGGTANVWGCPGCTSGGGGGFSGGWASTTGAASFRGWSDRTTPTKENRTYPAPLGTYNNLPVGWGSPAWVHHILQYISKGEPCRWTNNYKITDGGGFGSAATAPTITRDPNGSYANNPIGVRWFETRLWDAGAKNLLATNLYFGECLTPPEPTISWVNCPIEIDSISFAGPYSAGATGKLPTEDKKGKSVSQSSVTNKLAGPIAEPADNAAAPPLSWWYINGTAPINIDGLTWSQIQRLPEYQAHPEKRFSAFMRAYRKGLVGENAWIQKPVWDNLIAPCAGKDMTVRSSNPIGKDAVQNDDAQPNMRFAGNYTYNDKITYARCAMVNYPPTSAQISNDNIGTGIPAGTHWETWGWEYRKQLGTFYGCTILPPHNQTFNQTVITKCNSSGTPAINNYGSNFTGFNTVAGEDYNKLYWDNPGCDDTPPATPPPTVCDPDKEICASCDPAKETCDTDKITCSKMNNGSCETTIETSAFCAYNPGTTDASILTADNPTAQKNEATVLADGTAVKVSWPQATPVFQDPLGQHKPLTDAQVAANIKDVKTTYLYDASGGYRNLSGDSAPIAADPALGTRVPATTTSTPSAAYNFYKGTKDASPVTVKTQTTFSYKTTKVTNTLVLENGKLIWVNGTPVETWVEGGACPPLEAKITPTQVRNGN